MVAEVIPCFAYKSMGVIPVESMRTAFWGFVAFLHRHVPLSFMVHAKDYGKAVLNVHVAALNGAFSPPLPIWHHDLLDWSTPAN
jgi:hypothetical protein